MARRRKIRPEDLAKVPGGLRLYAQFGMRLPGGLALRLKSYCRATGQSLNETVMAALEQYLARASAPQSQAGPNGSTGSSGAPNE
jgi:hypothetical protein